MSTHQEKTGVETETDATEQNDGTSTEFSSDKIEEKIPPLAPLTTAGYSPDTVVSGYFLRRKNQHRKWQNYEKNVKLDIFGLTIDLQRR